MDAGGIRPRLNNLAASVRERRGIYVDTFGNGAGVVQCDRGCGGEVQIAIAQVTSKAGTATLTINEIY